MKKEFESPELIIIYFTNDEIITGSGPEDNLNGEDGSTDIPLSNP